MPTHLAEGLPLRRQAVGFGAGVGATTSVGVGITVGEAGDTVAAAEVGVDEVGVAVGGTRRCGAGKMTRTVPQIMLTATRALSMRNSLPPGCRLPERFTSYLPYLLAFTRSQALQSWLRTGIDLQRLLQPRTPALTIANMDIR